MIRVEGHDNLYRDEKTGAIVNNDSSGYESYMRQRNRLKSQRAEIDTMKKDISEIKDLLAKIVDKL